MQIAARDLAPGAAYRLLTGCVVPRPIAWISTLSPGGRANLAPYSCYTIACIEPPMLLVTFGPRGGALKDTTRNILETREFVVNIATDSMAELVHASSAECGPETSEPEALGLALLPGTQVRAPRIAISPIQLECRYEQSVELGERGDLVVFGSVVHFHIRDDLHQSGKIRSDLLSPLARLAGPNYASLGPMMTLPPATLERS